MVVFLWRAEGLLRPGSLRISEPLGRRVSLRTESLRLEFWRTETFTPEKYGGVRRARIAPRTPREETL